MLSFHHLSMLMAAVVLIGAAPPTLALTSGPAAPTSIDERTLLVPVRGCHHDVENHYVPEVGRRMRHYHRGRNCRPYDAEWDRRRNRHCHRDVERHYVPEVGRRVWHYHRGRNCRPIAADRRDRHDHHCHRDGRRHFHDRWGTVVHRHAGRNCHVELFRQHHGSHYDGCVRLGFLTFCP